MVVDDKGTTLFDATVAVSWDGGSRTEQPCTDDGCIQVLGVPSGLVTISARSPGHAALRVRKSIPWVPASVLILALDPSGVLVGDVRRADGSDPEGPLEIVYWLRGNTGEPLVHRIAGDVPGHAFRIEDAPPGDVFLAPLSGRDGVGATSAVQVVAGEETRVSLRLAVPRSLSGKVVDQDTGRPIEGALAQVMLVGGARSEGGAVALNEDSTEVPLPSARTGRDGSFVLDAGMPAGATLRVGAAGHSAQERRISDKSEDDLGTIALARSQPLTVCLITRDPLPDGWSIESDDGRIPPTRFGPDGCLIFDDFSAGPLEFALIAPDRGIGFASSALDAGKEWRIEIPLEGLGAARVVFDVPSPPPGELLLLLSYQPAPGFELTRSLTLHDLEPMRVEGIPGGTVTARLRVVGGQQIGTASGTLAPGDDELTLTVHGGLSRRFELVDASGDPLVGATLYVTPGGEVSGQFGHADEQGACRVDGLPEGSLVALLKHASGVRPSIPIEPDLDPQTIVLDPAASLETHVTLDGLPVAGATCLLIDPGAWRVILGPTDTDERGTVAWRGLHEGRYLLQVRKTGLVSVDRDVLIARAEEAQADVRAARSD